MNDISGKYNYVYKITNNLNNKTYIGVHKTENLDDGYMGSGTLIKRAIKKYGVENFTKEILEFFDSYRDALAKERELAHIDYVNSAESYNLREGGWGGCAHSEESKRALSTIAAKRWSNPEFREKVMPMYSSIERRRTISVGVKRWIRENPEKHAERMYKINKNPEKIRKMAEKHRGTKRSETARANIARAIRESNANNPEAVLRKSGRGGTYKYNIETKEVARCNKTDLIELPWIFGSGPKKSKENYQGMHKGSIFIYNEVTDTMSRIPKDASIPEGFKKGKRPTKLYGRPSKS